MSTVPMCEYGDCRAPATVWFDVTWTIADFAEFQTCDDHVSDMSEWIHGRKVEGAGPISVETHEIDTTPPF